MESLSSLLAACYSAACRPPTSGGTGGSSARGAAPGKAGKPPKGMSEKTVGMGVPKHTETEFTRKIRDAMDADPIIRGAFTGKQATDHVTGYIERMHEKAVMGAVEGIVKRRTLSVTSSSMNAPDALNAERTLTAAIDRLYSDPQKRINPTDPYEVAAAKILNDIEKDPASKPGSFGGSYTYMTVDLPMPDGTIERVTIDYRKAPSHFSNYKGRNLVRDLAADGPSLEAASTRIGSLVRQEIESRTEIAMTAALLEAGNNLDTFMAKGRETRKASGTRGDIHYFQDYNNGGVLIAQWGNLTREQNASDPDMKALNELIGNLGIKSLKREEHLRSVETDVHRKVFHEVMREIRPMGGTIDGTPGHKARKGALSSHEQVVSATESYPATWLKISNMTGSVSFRATKSRAHYSDSKDEITLDGRIDTAVHELGHRMESRVPGLAQLESAFFERRTAGETERRLKELEPNKSYSASEWAKPDGFFSPYCGKTYDGWSFELVSMGVEKMATGGIKGMDSDYADFILGALATVGRDG